MRIRRFWDTITFVLLAVAAALFVAHPAFAETSSSSHYQVTETQFNGGAELNSCSSGYCAQVAIGSSSVGNSTSAGGTSVSFGPVIPDRPTLDVIVEPGISNLGTLTTEHTGVKTMKVKIRSYLSNGYSLQINGDPPKYSGYKLKTSATPTFSTPGTEQFGINAVLNTTPNFGANPVQVPDAQTSFGQVSANYSQQNKFMYNSGDVVGFSTTESGQTDYTITMIVNIAGNTPTGQFQGDYSAIVIPLY